MITELKEQLFLPVEKNYQGESYLRKRAFYKNFLDNKPLIGIIIVLYNCKKNLEQTIKSVLEQSNENIKYIIIDGNFKDSTLNIIKKYENRIDYWAGELNGAIDKIGALCSRKYIPFLNADDCDNNDTFKSVVNSLKTYNIDYLFGNTDLYNNIILCIREKKSVQYKFNTLFGHQSLFVKMQCFLSELFNRKDKVFADYNFKLGRVIKILPYIYLDKSIVNYRINCLSSTANSKKEKFDIYYTYFDIIRAIYSYFIVSNNLLIKHINIIINGICSIKKQVKTV